MWINVWSYLLIHSQLACCTNEPVAAACMLSVVVAGYICCAVWKERRETGKEQGKNREQWTQSQMKSVFSAHKSKRKSLFTMWAGINSYFDVKSSSKVLTNITLNGNGSETTFFFLEADTQGRIKSIGDKKNISPNPKAPPSTLRRGSTEAQLLRMAHK